ncbi:MAG: hypothetical protein PHU97_04640 [Bacteroidales bacterium]|nr:hypothetical protein [Bacteroidales bacterium]
MENKLTHLGHTSGYPQQYDPSVLEAIPRLENRVKYGITNDNPGFLAFDIWHAWEAGFLTQNGLPVAGVLKIIFSGNGPFIIESKSLKLYLSSFNMTRLGNHPEEGISLLLQTIQNDLDRVLETRPTVAFSVPLSTVKTTFPAGPYWNHSMILVQQCSMNLMKIQRY